MQGSRCPVYTGLCVLCCTVFISLFLTTQLHTKTYVLSFTDQLNRIESDIMYVLLMASSGVKSECKHPVRELAAENLSTVTPHSLLANSHQCVSSSHKGLFGVPTSPLFLLRSPLIPLLTFIWTREHTTMSLSLSRSLPLSFCPRFRAVSSYTLAALYTVCISVRSLVPSRGGRDLEFSFISDTLAHIGQASARACSNTYR